MNIKIVAISTLLFFNTALSFSQLDTLNTGTGANSHNGDPIRTAAFKINDVINQINETYYSVTDFGAIGDGTTDDRLAVYNALSAAITANVPLYIPSGKIFYMNSAVSLAMSGRKDVKIFGGGTIYVPDFSGTVFTFTADTSNLSEALTYPIIKGDTLIKFSTTGLDILRGDICTIYSDSLWKNTADVYKGEIVKVRTIYGDTAISIYGSVSMDYSAANIIPIKKSTIEIEGVRFIGNNSTAVHPMSSMLDIRCFSRVKISKCEFSNCQYVAIRIDNCDNIRIHNNETYENSKSGFGYGVIVSGTNDAEIFNNRTDGSRHCVTTGHSAIYSHPVKYLSVHDNTYSNAPGFFGAIDTHHGTDFVSIENNTIHSGGVNIRSINTIIRNNKIYQRGNIPAIQIVCYNKWEGGYFIIDGNTCQAYDTTENTSFLYFANSLVQNSIIDNFIITNNKADVAYLGTQIFVNTDGNTIRNLKLCNNTIFTHSGEQWGLDIPSPKLKINKLLLSEENYYTNAGGGIRITCDTSAYLSLNNLNITAQGNVALYLTYFENIIINGGYFDSNYATLSLLSATKYLAIKNTFWNERSFNVSNHCDLSDILGNRYNPSYSPTINSLSQVTY
jgi:hypothetical protein